MRATYLLFAVLAVIFLLGSIYFVYIFTSLPGMKETKQYQPSGENKNDNYIKFETEESKSGEAVQPEAQLSLIPEKTQFYQNMRYTDEKISYKIENACNQLKKASVRESFDLLSQKTILTFNEVSEGGEIIILCSEVSPKPEQKNHFVAGEGGPTEIINTSLYNVILSGKISLFREERCNEPKIALHEILHVLGFDHNSNERSIMYSITGCEQKLDQYIIDTINTIYSVESLPDISITNVNATKKGKYLSFEIIVSNRGLKDASGVLLDIAAGGEKVKEFELKDIPIGTKKILTVENLRISGESDKIAFLVRMDDGSLELYDDNNKVELVLA